MYQSGMVVVVAVRGKIARSGKGIEQVEARTIGNRMRERLQVVGSRRHARMVPGRGFTATPAGARHGRAHAGPAQQAEAPTPSTVPGSPNEAGSAGRSGDVVLREVEVATARVRRTERTSSVQGRRRGWLAQHQHPARTAMSAEGKNNGDRCGPEREIVRHLDGKEARHPRKEWKGSPAAF